MTLKEWIAEQQRLKPQRIEQMRKEITQAAKEGKLKPLK